MRQQQFSIIDTIFWGRSKLNEKFSTEMRVENRGSRGEMSSTRLLRKVNLRKRQRRDFTDLGKSAETFVATCKLTLCGTNEFSSACLQQLDVCLRRRVLPHFPVHGGGDEQRSQRGECDFRKRMARESVRKFRDQICRGW